MSVSMVIKLGLLTPGEETIFRRFSIQDFNGTSQDPVSILQTAAVHLFSTSGAAPPQDCDASTFDVVLTYVDTEGDKVLIHNHNDFLAACTEWKNQNILKVFATVKPKQSSSPAVESATQTAPASGPPPSRSVAPERVPAKSATAKPSLPDAVDALVGVLTTASTVALKTLQKQMQEPSPTRKKNRVTKQANQKSTQADTAPARENNGSIASDTIANAHPEDKGERNNLKAEDKDSPADVVVDGNPKQPVEADKISVEQSSQVPTSPDTAGAITTTSEKSPFIHGRHTCDNCLATPIIGKRFHAINQSDYDLCEACFRNFQWKSISFVEEELERDRVFQCRWQRRHAKWSQGRGHCRMNRMNAKHAHSPSHCLPHGAVRVHFDPAAGHNNTSEVIDEDFALKEAIRRSMEETSTTLNVLDPCSKVVDVDVALQEVIQLSLDEGTKSRSTPSQESTETQKITLAILEQQDESTDSHKITSSSNLEKQDARSTKSPEVRMPEPEILLPLAPTTPLPVPSTPRKSESSFAVEAAGCGEVAEGLGETLDKIASAIDDVNLELERPTSYDDLSDDEDDVPTSNQVCEEAGATILDGEITPHDEDDTESNRSWQVVCDQISSDEALARAAEAIGSALFNSDMARSHDTPVAWANTSSTSHSRVSSVSSVPSTLPSVAAGVTVNNFQLERWAVELGQLHELGFLDDTTNIDVIERLTAASIGVDSTDQVTIGQIVNELIKDW